MDSKAEIISMIKECQGQINGLYLELSTLVSKLNRLEEMAEALDVQSPRTENAEPTEPHFIVTKVFEPAETPRGKKTINELFALKTDGEMLIVEKKGWFNDYCLVVHKIKDGTAIGNTYRKGQIHAKREHKDANEKGYKVYSGEYVAKIVEEERRIFWEEREKRTEEQIAIAKSCTNCAKKNNDNCPYGQNWHDDCATDGWVYDNSAERKEREGWPEKMDATTLRSGGHPQYH